ncbi:MAG: dTMP kinase [Treponema sp.]|jgi:dTMP kinase|nr:dTMP kinase [Treponema sp.]
MNEIIRNFAVFEGGDGSGTSTQLSLLEKRLAGLSENAAVPGGPVFYPTFEPTEGPVGKLVRSALKKEISLRPESLARLFTADRTEHLFAPGGILERCRRGELVVSDRYALSSLVYQGIECGDELPHSLNASFPLPELLLFFDIDPEIACGRIQNRPFPEIYEYREFQQRVREKYKALLGEYEKAGVRVETLDAAKSAGDVAEDVWRALEKMPILRGREKLVRSGENQGGG